MKKITAAALSILWLAFGQAQHWSFNESMADWDRLDFPQTPYEASGRLHTATVEQASEWYQLLASQFPDRCELVEMGPSDAALPIQVFVISSRSSNPIKVLVNNAIHPGEPEGVDACMLWVRDVLLAEGSTACDEVEYHIVLHYNVGGAMNRNSYSRANQAGPEVYGFRGNSQNLDLNRDFIKMDSRNAESFERYFSRYQFDYFIDNHTSNGADYQYALTFFFTHADKLHPVLKDHSLGLEAALRQDLFLDGWINAPYVQTREHTPESGLVGFFETGRYATGYTALHHCIGICVETHMLKPFPQRVEATLAFLEAFSNRMASAPMLQEAGLMELELRKSFSSEPWVKSGDYLPIRFELSSTPSDTIEFYGFQHGYRSSALHGQDRLFYDRNQPQTFAVPYWNHYVAVDSARVPRAYILPRGFSREVIQRIGRQRGVSVVGITKDTTMELTLSRLLSMKTSQQPYEGHYLHSQIQTEEFVRPVRLQRGDILIKVTPENALFLVNVLEPRAPDSYFAWNFFDACLQQKEWFSDYVFEDMAAEWLESQAQIKDELEAKMKADPEWAKNAGAVLAWVYQKGPWSEPSVNEIPVYRLY
ncbi:MAG: hypothetical protein RL577_858 [Bacteroidota bacterium]